MQAQQAQNIQDGHPRVWVPGQGWVAIDPDWERQDEAPSMRDEGMQADALQQDKSTPSQERWQGYDADSETDGSELQGPPSDKAEAGSTESADREPDEDQNQQRDEERREGKPPQSAYALSQGVQVSEHSGHDGEEHESAEGWQKQAQFSEQGDTKQTDQEHVSDKDAGREDSERQDDGGSPEYSQQDGDTPAPGTTEGQQLQTSAKPLQSSREHVETTQQRNMGKGKVRFPLAPN